MFGINKIIYDNYNPRHKTMTYRDNTLKNILYIVK